MNCPYCHILITADGEFDYDFKCYKCGIGYVDWSQSRLKMDAYKGYTISFENHDYKLTLGRFGGDNTYFTNLYINDNQLILHLDYQEVGHPSDILQRLLKLKAFI